MLAVGRNEPNPRPRIGPIFIIAEQHTVGAGEHEDGASTNGNGKDASCQRQPAFRKEPSCTSNLIFLHGRRVAKSTQTPCPAIVHLARRGKRPSIRCAGQLICCSVCNRSAMAGLEGRCSAWLGAVFGVNKCVPSCILLTLCGL